MNVRSKVMKSAERLFSTNGYEQTSIQQIIDDADVSKGGLYHHFKSKEEILNELLLDFAKQIKEKFEKSNDDHDNLKDIITNFANLKSMIPEELQQFYLRFLMSDDIYIREKFIGYLTDQLVDPLNNVLSDFGKFDNPEVVAYFTLMLTSSSTRLPKDKLSDPKFIDHYHNILMDCIEVIYEL